MAKKFQETPEEKLKKRLAEQAEQDKKINPSDKSTEAKRKENEAQRKRAIEEAKKSVEKEEIPPKSAIEGNKEFIGPKYTPYLERPNGKKYLAQSQQLEKKILSGTATADERHEYYLITGKRAKDLD